MERLLQARGLGFVCLALLASCSSTRPRGQVVRLQPGFPVESKLSEEAPANESFVISDGKGSLVEVPSSTEDAAIFHFSLGQAYSLDNDPQRAIESYRATLVHDPKSALVRARMAAELVKLANFSEARQLCEEAIRLDPKYVDSYLLLAGIEVAAKEYEKAIDTYHEALKVEPRNRDALLYLGVTLAEVGRMKDAVADLEKLVKLKDSAESSIDQSVAYYYLAKIYDQAGRRESAIKAYEMALKKRPGFAKAALALSDLYIARRDIQKGYAVLEEAFAEGRSADLAERLAERRLERNDYKGAIVYLETLVEEDPTNENMKLRLALIYWQVQWFDKARQLLVDLHARYPNSSEIAFYLGELELERNDFESALEYYGKVSSDYAKYDQMISRVAFVYRQKGKLGEAEEFLLESLRKRPDLVSIYPLLASVYEDQKKFEEARLVLERGERLFPTDENILYYLGFSLDRMGNREKALSKMEKLLGLNPNNANALNFVGYTLLEQGERLDQARNYLERAVSLKPEDAFILDSYGWLLYRLGKRREAMKQLEKAYAIKPEEGVIGEHLADVYVALNMSRKALAIYERALSSGGEKEFLARVQAKVENMREVLGSAERRSPPSPTSMAEPDSSERTPASGHSR